MVEMVITFLSGYKDFGDIAFHAWRKKYSPAKYIRVFAYVSVLIGIISSIPVLIFSNVKWPALLTVLLVTILTFLTLYRMIPQKRAFRSQYKKLLNGRDDIQTTIELLDEGLRVDNLGQQTLFRWHSLNGFVETDERFVFLSSFGTGIGVPKRAFETQEQLGSFLAFSRSRLQLPENN